MARFFLGYEAWKKQRHLLNKMDLKDLNRAFVTYPGVQIYAALLVASFAAALTLAWGANFLGWLALAGAAAAAVVVYPLAWYLIHRFILHGSFLYKTPWTAPLWKRIHFDHHRNPNDLSVLFGGLHTTIPTIVAITAPIGFFIAGLPGAFAGVGAAIAMTCFYEYCHCIQHLGYEPKWAFLRDIKRLHMAHHFHNENGNYGITNFLWDKILRTHYPDASAAPRSATVRNLGYMGEETEKYPWVARLSDAPDASRDADDGERAQAPSP